MTVGVYGSLLDLGFTTSNGYSSDGTSGGGSTGSSSFPDGFVCPQTEWWCESGDYRYIGDVLYTPESYPGMNENFPWLWWESDVWLSNPNNFTLDVDQNYELNAAEKVLVKKYPVAAYFIRGNVQKAIQETIIRFGTNGLNDKSDAFRHTFFNAMNERDCGKDNITLESIARKFSDAHESEVPPQLQKEKDMDLFNNSVGHQIGDVFFPIFTSDASLANSAWDKLFNGELRYLKPIWPPKFGPSGQLINPTGDPNFYGTNGTNNPVTATHGITASTFLIPTNQ